NQLGTLCRVEQTASTLVAMRACLTSPPDAVFLGTSSALLDDDMFARKWGERPELRSVPLFRLIAPEAAAPECLSASEVPVHARTLDVSTFLEQIKTVLSPASAARLLLGPASPGVSGMFDMAHRLFGDVLGSDVRMQPSAAVIPPAAQRWVDVTLRLDVEQEFVELKLQCPHLFGLIFASQ